MEDWSRRSDMSLEGIGKGHVLLEPGLIGWLGPKRKLGWAFLASASSAVRVESRQHQHPKQRPDQGKQSFHVSLRGRPRVLCKVLVEAKSVEAANPVEPPLCLRQPVTLGKPS